MYRKKKLYLDTSAISYLRQEDSPKEMAETIAFWDILRQGKYDVFISEVVINELTACAEPKRTELFALLSEIEYTDIRIDGVRIVCVANNLTPIDIYSPAVLQERSDFDE